MAATLPITLEGETLGKRHHNYNEIIYKTENNVFGKLKDLPEKSAIDRLFKIDVASKERNVDYIINNLKSDDMLFVSRALKAKWILDDNYEDIINPKYLENILYPSMITTAVSKTKHFIYLNLKNEIRNKHFYEHYAETNFEYAIKFLLNCAKEYVENTFPIIIHKINVHYFKILCEKYPKTAKIFFDAISTDEKIKRLYLNNEKEYFKSVAFVLKSEPDIYFEIYEKYFSLNVCDRMSPSCTKYIMMHHKERFMAKPELYAAWLMNIKTLAACLSVDESKTIVEKLAKSSYLRHWFDYKTVEPFVKRLKPTERAEFKKHIFIERDKSVDIADWPYETPSRPILEEKAFNIFEDYEHTPDEYARLEYRTGLRKLTKRCCKSAMFSCDMVYESCGKVKTMLDKLFNEFRFSSFEKTLYELRKRIPVESSSQNREYMMLVLVSKTGGRADAIESLLDLLANHSNEPSHVRAAIIRSLVKRAFVWRLPDKTWSKLLEFARGLGLDGKAPEADCIEGLHSVVIRNFLTNTTDVEVQRSFLEKFSNLTEYSLTVAEKKFISEALPKMLLSAVKECKNAHESTDLVTKLIDTLQAYTIDVAEFQDFIPTVKYWVEKDFETYSNILLRLYSLRIGRKELFKQTFDLNKSDSSYINALKHDLSVIDIKKIIEAYEQDNLKLEQFLKKVNIYFNEENGLASQLLNAFKLADHNKVFARPLSVLLGHNILEYLEGIKTTENIDLKLLASSVKSNAHLARPNLNLYSVDWTKLGPKFVASKSMIRPKNEIESLLPKLLIWKPSSKIAFELSKRINKELEVLENLAKTKPTFAVKVGIKLMRKSDDEIADKIWMVLKPLITDLDVSKTDKCHVLKLLSNVDSLPANIRPEFSTIMFEKFKEVSFYKSMYYLSFIEGQLTAVNDDVIEKILKDFLENIDKKLTSKREEEICNKLFIRILVKYLLLSKTEDEQKRKIENFGQKLLDGLELKLDDKSLFFEYLTEIMTSLKYTKVFLNVEYVNCLPVMEKVVSFMQKTLPMEKYFGKFIFVHLTMLYYKAIRNSVNHHPDIFKNESIMVKDGTKIVGYIFGKLIAKELNELVEKYFETIIEIYSKNLTDFLFEYFNYYSHSDFPTAIIKGIIDGSKGDEYRLAIYVLQKQHSIDKNESGLMESIKQRNDDKTTFFVYSELY